MNTVEIQCIHYRLDVLTVKTVIQYKNSTEMSRKMTHDSFIFSRGLRVVRCTNLALHLIYVLLSPEKFLFSLDLKASERWSSLFGFDALVIVR